LVFGAMSLPLAIGLNIASFVVAFVFVFMIFRRVNNLASVKAEYDKPRWKGFVVSLFVLTIVSSLYNRLDTIMLGSIKDAAQVGIYYAAERDASSLFFFMYVMNMIIAPSLAGLNKPEDKQKLQHMITRTIRWVMLCTLPVFAIMMIFSGQIMHLSGPEFLPGKIALIIISCGVLVDIAFGPVGYFALMTGNEKYNTIYMAISIGLNIALNLLLTPTMGFIGTAISTASCTIFWNAAMFITMYRKTGIRTWIFG
jgi:O-antigen/teichoic acid export membrane protein